MIRQVKLRYKFIELYHLLYVKNIIETLYRAYLNFVMHKDSPQLQLIVLI